MCCQIWIFIRDLHCWECNIFCEFPENISEFKLEELFPGARISADVVIMQNIPSREAYHYVFFILDHATKVCWVFPLKTREFKHILAHWTTFVNEVLPSLKI